MKLQQLVAVTVDPENDTPAKLKMYAHHRELNTANGRWLLLTGRQETIYSLAKDTFASKIFKRDPREEGEGPAFVHSEHLYVIDGEGRLRGILNGTRVDVKEGARSLLSELKLQKSAPEASERRM